MRLHTRTRPKKSRSHELEGSDRQDPPVTHPTHVESRPGQKMQSDPSLLAGHGQSAAAMAPWQVKILWRAGPRLPRSTRQPRSGRVGRARTGRGHDTPAFRKSAFSPSILSHSHRHRETGPPADRTAAASSLSDAVPCRLGPREPTRVRLRPPASPPSSAPVGPRPPVQPRARGASPRHGPRRLCRCHAEPGFQRRRPNEAQTERHGQQPGQPHRPGPRPPRPRP